MRKSLPIAVAAGLLSSAASASAAETFPKTVHLKVEVYSGLYVPFTEDRDIPIGQPSVFERTTDEHNRVDYSGPCNVTSPVGVSAKLVYQTRIIVTPYGGPDDGKIFAQAAVNASKFVGQRKTEAKNCGTMVFNDRWDINFGNNSIYRLGHAEPLFHTSSDTKEGDLIVDLTFTPVSK
ncbi:hypothetical protein [Burkholderia glumae]|uniref:hypothetical protein n=1 Tax=Burkholderia glumae TaxID=337 RepID=UPI00215117DC|nr:hypothetical protein [Burkholderia glumae]